MLVTRSMEARLEMKSTDVRKNGDQWGCTLKSHPDKVCDQVSDAALDACLTSDAECEVACVACMKDNVVMAEEFTVAGNIDFETVVLGACREEHRF